MNRLCIAVADATRARLYTFEELAAPPGERTQLLPVRERIGGQGPQPHGAR